MRAAPILLLAAGCSAGLSAQHAAELRMAQKADLRAYAWAGPSSSAGAEARLAYCLTSTVLLQNDASTVGSDGAIDCLPPKAP